MCQTLHPYVACFNVLHDSESAYIVFFAEMHEEKKLENGMSVLTKLLVVLQGL